MIIIQERDDKVRIENSKNDTNEDELQLGPLFGLEGESNSSPTIKSN